jgi:hypothetical protein
VCSSDLPKTPKPRPHDILNQIFLLHHFYINNILIQDERRKVSTVILRKIIKKKQKIFESAIRLHIFYE